MKTISAGDFEIELFKDYSNSVDNINKYDFQYFEDDEYSYPTIIGIKIFKDDTLLKSALIGGNGGGTGIHKTAFILEIDRLVICCSDTIFCLSIPDLHLLWKTKADNGTCFEIYRLENDYIVHGELEITRLGKDGQIIWQQSGTDIFTTLNSTKDDFIITDKYILATDWENRKYKFDFNGNSIQ